MDPTLEAERPLDGRNVAPDLGIVEGEGGQQRVKEIELPKDRIEVREVPASQAIVTEEGPSYYGMPVLKEPVWRWMIPAYFFTGGLAGACAVLGTAAQATGGSGVPLLVRRCRLVAAGGAAVSAGLLIADLGKPSRFVGMMRVFRPTSPMNMGTWVLSGFSALSGIAAVPALVRTPRWVERTADVAWYGAGLFGLPLVGYTGVLISNTAVPVWQATRRTLPVLFAFSGAVSAGALFDLWPVRRRGNLVARRFGIAAKAAEMALDVVLHQEAKRAAPRVARPLRHGRSGLMLRAAGALVTASLALDLLPRRRHRLAGALAMAGTVLLRFGIMSAGRASARDPHATFEMQRRGHGARELGRELVRREMPSFPGVGARSTESFVGDAGPL